jgi:hypothetical protein
VSATCEHCNSYSGFIKYSEFLDQLNNCHVFNEGSMGLVNYIFIVSMELITYSVPFLSYFIAISNIINKKISQSPCL